MKQNFSLKKISNILIEASPSGSEGSSMDSGATVYEISESTYLQREALNRYLVKLYNTKLVTEDGDKLLTTQKGLEYLQKYHELQCMTKSPKKQRLGL
ncbi:MAG: winged helix-turn-helix domain-containing protein [Candidatus Aenigmatarchaeota archaeon]